MVHVELDIEHNSLKADGSVWSVLEPLEEGREEHLQQRSSP